MVQMFSLLMFPLLIPKGIWTYRIFHGIEHYLIEVEQKNSFFLKDNLETKSSVFINT